MQQNSSNSKVIKRKKVSVYTRKLKDGEVVPMVVDRAFKRVFADENHLERLNLLLGVVLNKKVNVIRILNNELIGRSRKTRKRAVDLVYEVEDYGLCNIEVNSALKWSRERNFGYLCRVIGEDDYLDVSEDEYAALKALRAMNGETYEKVDEVFSTKNAQISEYEAKIEE